MSKTKPVPIAPPPPPAPFIQEQDFAARQYRGRRDYQEDYYAFADAADGDEEALCRLLLVVGDGLGAHTGGSVASYVAVNSFVRAYHENDASHSWRLRISLDRANDTLGILTNRMPATAAPMGTTLVAILVSHGMLNWISVGDSPLFLFRAGELHRLNEDHSLTPILEERVERGELTREDAEHHPDRHTLQSALLGAPIPLVDFMNEPFILHSGDIIISASDGIFTLSHQQLEELLGFGKHTTADKIADAIIFAIRRINNERQDNTTVGVIKIP